MQKYRAYEKLQTNTKVCKGMKKYAKVHKLQPKKVH